MGTPLSSIGVRIGYLKETVAPTPDTEYPDTGFTHIPDLKSTPDFSSAPNTADASTFDNLEYTTYVELLKDLGGALQFTANLTDAFKSMWEDCVDDASTIGCWFCIDIPGIDDSVVFFGMPSPIGMPALTANSLMEATVSVTPYLEPKWIETS